MINSENTQYCKNYNKLSQTANIKHKLKVQNSNPLSVKGNIWWVPMLNIWSGNKYIWRLSRQLKPGMSTTDQVTASNWCITIKCFWDIHSWSQKDQRTQGNQSLIAIALTSWWSDEGSGVNSFDWTKTTDENVSWCSAVWIQTKSTLREATGNVSKYHLMEYRLPERYVRLGSVLWFGNVYYSTMWYFAVSSPVQLVDFRLSWQLLLQNSQMILQCLDE